MPIADTTGSDRPLREGGGRSFTAGLVAGLLAGTLTGLADAAFGVSDAGRFLPGAGGKAAFFLLSIASCGIAGAVAGLGLHSLLWLLLEGTAPGRALRDAWRQRRDMATLSAHAVALMVMLPVAGLGLQRVVLWSFDRFHHKGLTAALDATVALGVLLVALAAALLVAVPLGWALRPLFRLAGRVRLLAPVLGFLLPLLVLAGLVSAAAAWQWETVQNLPLRLLAAGLLLGLLVLVTYPLASACLPKPRGWRLGLPWAAVLVLVVLLLGLARSAALRKAGDMDLALTGPLLDMGRKLVDLDRDGFSAVFGGGDCDDMDPAVHPGAFDWPDDGIDQNCLGGDAEVRDRKPRPAFPVPDTVPDNLNVLLITVDALVATHMGCYGYERDTTPNLDRFAKTAVLFERSLSPAPSTRYAFPALMTSRYPMSVQWGEGSWPPPVLPENLTWAETMQEMGLYTAAILNHRFFRREWGLDQGFDLYDNSRARLHSGRSDPATHGTSSDQMADAVNDFLDKNRDRRFFLWVHFYDPHWYYETHPGFSIFGDSRTDLYDGEVRFTDHHIGRILSHVSELGLDRDTVILVAGDHGEGFGEHGNWLHGYHLYNAQTHVPILVRV